MIEYLCGCDGLPPHEHEVVAELSDTRSSLGQGQRMLVHRRTEHIARVWVDWRKVAYTMMTSQETTEQETPTDA